MVSLASGNYCGDLAALLPMGPGDAVLTAASNAGSTIGGASLPSIGTAMSSKTILAILGAGIAGYGLYSIIDDDDDEPTSP